AGECERLGHSSIILGLSDPSVRRIEGESQQIEGRSISALRLAAAMPWAERIPAAQACLKDFRPDWVSLQFVPFGFHPRGLPLGLGRKLSSINSAKPWHIMFHELWLGLGEGSSVKHRVWGELQRWLILDLIHRLRPKIVHTNAEAYRIV